MFYTETFGSKGFARNRLAITQAWLKGALTIGEAGTLMMPARFSSKRSSLVPKYDEFLRQQSERELTTFLEKAYPGTAPKLEGKDRISHIYQIFVRDEYGATEFLKPDSVVIDAGANSGVFSVFAAMHCKNGKIFSFEPVKSTYDVLLRNIVKYPQVTAFNLGLGTEEKTAEIRTSSRSPGINAVNDSVLAEKNGRFFDGSEKIQITTMDKAVEKQKLNRLDFIKIDTEGYESQILEGARATIKQFKPVIAMSAYHRENDQVELPKLLKSIEPAYVCKFRNKAEGDLVCYVPGKVN